MKAFKNDNYTYEMYLLKKKKVNLEFHSYTKIT